MTIDCLFVGDNTLSISERKLLLTMSGKENSIENRDLQMNLINYNGKDYTASDIFNRFYYDERNYSDQYGKVSSTSSINPAIAYLGNYLSKRELSFDFINSFRNEKNLLTKKLTENDVLTVAIPTTFYNSFFPIADIIGFIRLHNKKAKIIIGGPFILNWIEISTENEIQNGLKNAKVDIAVYNVEGEKTLFKIITALKSGIGLDNIKNIFYWNGANYIFNGSLAEDNDFEDDIINWKLFEGKIGSIVNVRTSKSCPFSCAFCNFPHFSGTYKVSPIDKVERILDYVNDLTTVSQVNFIDDTFNIPPERFKDILKIIIKKKYKFQWSSFFRCQYADEEMVYLMKESGCNGVFLGIESGSQKILDNMNKKVTVKQYQEGLKILNKYSITSVASIIVGFPGETYETFNQTRNFLENYRPTFYRASMWLCDPLSPIFQNGQLYDLTGKYNEWIHNTMDSETARNLVDELFMTVKMSTWIKNDEFDFEIVFHMLQRGMSLEQVIKFFSYFNKGLKETILTSAKTPVSQTIIDGLKSSCINHII